MIGGLYPIPSGGGKPEWGSPQKVHFVGNPGRRGRNIPPRDVKLVKLRVKHSLREVMRRVHANAPIFMCILQNRRG